MEEHSQQKFFIVCICTCCLNTLLSTSFLRKLVDLWFTTKLMLKKVNLEKERQTSFNLFLCFKISFLYECKFFGQFIILHKVPHFDFGKYLEAMYIFMYELDIQSYFIGFLLFKYKKCSCEIDRFCSFEKENFSFIIPYIYTY